jgi:hypothetical protein
MSSDRKYDRQLRRLRPMSVPTKFEQIGKSLFEEVCCGSRSLWPAMQNEELSKDPELRMRFFKLAHEGMWAAQERFLHRIHADEPLVGAEEALYRGAMDTIGWSLLQRQLCFARRLYREKHQPSLSNSNLQSVVGAARYFREENPDSIPLISDLTTFIQVGDILAFDHSKGTSIIEVKEGGKNLEIGKLASFYRHSKCERFRQLVADAETKHSYKQFERVVRQMDRLEFATDVLGTGRGFDPDDSIEVRIPEPYIPVESWDGRLNDVFTKALEKGWALDVIDNSLFIACYASDHMKAASPAAFLGWFNHYTEGDRAPVARLIDCMIYPLALPIFAMHMHPERMMDVLFGRIHVCMGISIPSLVEECTKRGIAARAPSRSEKRAMNESQNLLVKYNGEPLILERDGKSLPLADGIYMRMMFHMQTPISVIEGLFQTDASSMEI